MPGTIPEYIYPTPVRVSKEYIKQCLQQRADTAGGELFDSTPESMQTTVRDLLCSVLYCLTGLTEQQECAETKVLLQKPDTLENQLFSLIVQALTPSDEQTMKELSKDVTPGKRIALKKARAKQVEALASSITQRINATPNAIRDLALQQHKRITEKSKKNNLSDLLAIVDALPSDDDHIQMHIRRLEDPTYEINRVHHLIRLGLHDAPQNIKLNYVYDETSDQQPIVNSQRIWLGMFELSDMYGSTTNEERDKRRAVLAERIHALIASGRWKNQELCISVKTYCKDGGGHYQLLTLTPTDKPNHYIMREVNSLLPKDPHDGKSGMSGELRTIVEQSMHGTITDFQPQKLINQPTNLSCGPTHVETVRAIMTQSCFYGKVLADYTRQLTIYPTVEQARDLRIQHAQELNSNETTCLSVLMQGQEFSPFALIMPGKSENDFGFVPPLPGHFEMLTASTPAPTPVISPRFTGKRDTINELCNLRAVLLDEIYRDDPVALQGLETLTQLEIALKAGESSADILSCIDYIRTGVLDADKFNSAGYKSLIHKVEGQPSLKKIIFGALLAFFGAVVVAAATTVAIASLGIATPLSVIGIAVGANMTTTGVAIACGVIGGALFATGLGLSVSNRKRGTARSLSSFKQAFWNKKTSSSASTPSTGLPPSPSAR